MYDEISCVSNLVHQTTDGEAVPTIVCAVRWIYARSIKVEI